MMDKKAFYQLTYGLFVLACADGEKDNACIINTVIQSASSPNKLSFAVNKANYTAELLAAEDDVAVSVISEEADFALFQRFGFQSGRNVDKFAGLSEVLRTENGTLAVTRGTNAYFAAHIVQRQDVGSHILFTAEVTESQVLSHSAPVTYAYYLANIKPKPQKPTKTVWRCKVCGYEYDSETLPEDFICPLCKHGAADFEPISG